MVGEIWDRILETGGSDRIFPSSDYMFQLIYRFLSRPGPDLGDLDDIPEEAIATDSARNISGCLIHHNTRFVQILEGSKKDVPHVFNRIRTDDRHHTVILPWENHVESKFFEEWNMAF